MRSASWQGLNRFRGVALPCTIKYTSVFPQHFIYFNFGESANFKMLLLYIIFLIITGILLLVLEILILPGLIAGIVGAILIIIGIFLSFQYHGAPVGYYTMAGAAILTFAAIFYSLKSKAWQRFSLKDSLGKANEVDKLEIQEGDEGVTLSALRPMGSVQIRKLRVEAQSTGEFIQPNTPVLITKVLSNKVIVKPK